MARALVFLHVSSRPVRNLTPKETHDKHIFNLSHVMYRIFAVAQAGGVVPGRHS